MLEKQDTATPVYPVGPHGRQITWWQVGFAIGCGIWILSALPFVVTVAFVVYIVMQSIPVP